MRELLLPPVLRGSRERRTMGGRVAMCEVLCAVGGGLRGGTRAGTAGGVGSHPPRRGCYRCVFQTFVEEYVEVVAHDGQEHHRLRPAGFLGDVALPRGVGRASQGSVPLHGTCQEVGIAVVDSAQHTLGGASLSRARGAAGPVRGISTAACVVRGVVACRGIPGKQGRGCDGGDSAAPGGSPGGLVVARAFGKRAGVRVVRRRGVDTRILQDTASVGAVR